MGRKAGRAVVGRAARRARTAATGAARTRWARMYAAVERVQPPAARVGTGLVDVGEYLGSLARAEQAVSGPVMVRDDTLTRDQRDALDAALAEWMLEGTHDYEVPYEHEEQVAYHAGFPLASAWLIFSGTEAPSLAEVFDRLGLVIDPHHWDDGWSEYSDRYGIACPECGTTNWGKPSGWVNDEPRDATWPGRCRCCDAALHHVMLWQEDGEWWARCTCGDWETPNGMKGERYAKGAGTRHLNKVGAAVGAAA